MRSSLLISLGVALAACGRSVDPPPLFERLAPSVTGVTFENRLPEDSTLNILNFLYYYNGGGVAAGDVDGDGRPDLYFTSNLGSNRLYLNRGGYRFEDVTARAGVAGPTGWKSGVTMADVDGDGRLDIYVSTVSYRGLRGRNALYVNNGDGTFTDRAHDFGIDFEGYATQAAFFDYDVDGDLDLFVLSFSTHDDQMSGAPKRDVKATRGGGRLYRNDGGRFVDVSASAGIYGGADGFGLGLVVSDLDLDGCPDVYVANDFQENDFLYHNECDGTFTESIARATGHTSRFSMGVDAADVNDDGRPDLVVADMLPDQPSILQSSASTEDYALSELRDACRLPSAVRPQHAAAQPGRRPVQRHRVARGSARHRLELGAAPRRPRRRWTQGPLRHERHLPPSQRSRLHRLRRPAVGAGRARGHDHLGESRAAATHAAGAGAQSRVPQCRRAAIHRCDEKHGGSTSAASRMAPRTWISTIAGPSTSSSTRSARRRRSTGIAAAARPENAIAHGDAPWRCAEHGGHRRQAVRSHRRTHSARRAVADARISVVGRSATARRARTCRGRGLGDRGLARSPLPGV